MISSIPEVFRMIEGVFIIPFANKSFDVAFMFMGSGGFAPILGFEVAFKEPHQAGHDRFYLRGMMVHETWHAINFVNWKINGGKTSEEIAHEYDDLSTKNNGLLPPKALKSFKRFGKFTIGVMEPYEEIMSDLGTAVYLNDPAWFVNEDNKIPSIYKIHRNRDEFDEISGLQLFHEQRRFDRYPKFLIVNRLGLEDMEWDSHQHFLHFGTYVWTNFLSNLEHEKDKIKILKKVSEAINIEINKRELEPDFKKFNKVKMNQYEKNNRDLINTFNNLMGISKKVPVKIDGMTTVDELLKMNQNQLKVFQKNMQDNK
jgi:hypothetical protein